VEGGRRKILDISNDWGTGHARREKKGSGGEESFYERLGPAKKWGRAALKWKKKVGVSRIRLSPTNGSEKKKKGKVHCRSQKVRISLCSRGGGEKKRDEVYVGTNIICFKREGGWEGRVFNRVEISKKKKEFILRGRKERELKESNRRRHDT